MVGRGGDAEIVAERARAAGLDLHVLNGLLGAMDPPDRERIRALSARDLEATRRNAAKALDDNDMAALERHLHVMTSLARTLGANDLAEEAARLQVWLRDGGTGSCSETARRMDELAERAVGFLADGDG